MNTTKSESPKKWQGFSEIRIDPELRFYVERLRALKSLKQRAANPHRPLNPRVRVDPELRPYVLQLRALQEAGQADEILKGIATATSLDDVIALLSPKTS